MTQQREIKNTGIGIGLSFLWVGLGQLYAGEVTRGIVMMVAFPFVILFGIFAMFWALGSGAGVLTGLAYLAQGLSGAGVGAALGGLGLVLLNGAVGLVAFCCGLSPVAFWIWGMLDAKRLCEQFNRED